MRTRLPPTRAGFSLFQLVVLLAMLGLFLALLLPAVQKVREARNRIECANNLKQIGLACHNFHDVNGRFPTSPGGEDALGGLGIAYAPDGTPLSVKYQTAGWAFQVLPYLEQKNLYNTSDLHSNKHDKHDNIYPADYPDSDLAKATEADFPAKSYNIDLFKPAGPVRGTLVKMYYCPSRRPPRLYHGVAAIDYAATHPDAVPIPRDKNNNYSGDPYGSLLMTNPAGLHGVISARSEKVTMEIVANADGLANTMMIAEKFVRPVDYRGGGQGDFMGWAQYGGLDTCRSTTAVHGWVANPSRDRNDIADGQDEQFGSAHPRGINALFADGSVHHVIFGIDQEVFNALGCRDDGFNPQSDDY